MTALFQNLEIQRLSRDNRLLALSLFLWGLGEGLTLYIRPVYLAELGASPSAIGSAIALAFAAGTITHIPAGYLADRFGRKQLLLAGWIIGIFATGVMYLARDLQTFVIGLVIYMFTGFVVAPINAYVTAARGEQSVQRALTLVSAGFWSGNILSPALGGQIGEVFGLRTVYGLAIIAYIASTVALFFLRAQPLSPPIAGAKRYDALFANRRFIGFLILMFFALNAMQLGLPFAPNFVKDVRGFDVGDIGLFGSVTSLAAVTLNLLFGQRAPRRGFLFAQSLVLVYLGLLLFVPAYGGLLLAFAFQAGWNFSRSMMIAQVGRVVEAHELGLAYGLLETVGSSVLIIGPYLAGNLYEADPRLPFQLSFGLIVMCIPIVWLFTPQRDPSAEVASVPLASDNEAVG